MRVVPEGKLHIKQNMQKSKTFTAMNKLPQFTFGEYNLCDSAYLVSVLPQVEKNFTLDLGLTNSHVQFQNHQCLQKERVMDLSAKTAHFLAKCMAIFGDKAIIKVHKLWDLR